MKPTANRKVRIAMEAATIDGLCNSPSSRGSLWPTCIAIFGNRYAFKDAAKNAMTPSPSAARVSINCKAATGPATTKPVMPDICPNLLLDSTNFDSSLTVVGTIADFAMA